MSDPTTGSPTGSADDRALHLLLEDAVADVEPRPGLDAIRSRTRRPAPARRGWAWGVGGAVLATAATVAVVVVLTHSPGTTGAGPDPAGGPTSTGSGDDTVTTTVWFVGGTSHGERLFPEPHQFRDGDQVGPLQTAVSGAAADPDYRSAWPRGITVESVETDGSSPEAPVVVNLSGPDLTSPRDGVRGAQVELAVHQLVRTVHQTTYPQSPIELRVEGRPVRRLFGMPIAFPLVSWGSDRALAQVQVTSPVDGSTWSGPDPITVEGQAAAFEANVQWELKQGETVVKRGFTTAQECCTLSPFSFPIPLPPPGDYTLVVHDEDPSGGEGQPSWQDTKRITVR